jgi:hypothetical protein
VSLLRDPARRREIGQAARALVARDYAWEGAVRRYLSLVQSPAARSGG